MYVKVCCKPSSRYTKDKPKGLGGWATSERINQNLKDIVNYSNHSTSASNYF